MIDSDAPSTAISPMTGAPSRLLFRHAVLGKHQAEYYLDETAGYIFVKSPHWLGEAYSSAISVLDNGCYDRNIRNVGIVTRALSRRTGTDARGVDLGGGYGLFVRGMRDRGFEFFWSDKYADNLLARGFEAAPGTYATATAFEVLEHTENPLAFLEEGKQTFGFETCFFSATCFDDKNPPSPEWWYWLFETGQHISFFSERTLRDMAAKLGMQLIHVESDVYAFSSRPEAIRLPGALDRQWRSLQRSAEKRLYGKRKSLIVPDHDLLKARLRAAQKG